MMNITPYLLYNEPEPEEEEPEYFTEWDIMELGLSLWIVDELTN